MLLVAWTGAIGTEPPRSLAFTDEEVRWIRDHPVVSIAIEANWHPIEYLRDGTHAGLVVGYLNTISRLTGLTFRVEPDTERGQAYPALISGKVDLLPGVWRELARERIGSDGLISSSYLVGRVTVVTRSDSTMIFNLRRLAGRRIAIKGRSAVEYFVRHSDVKLDVLTYESEEGALAAVASGEADAALGLDVTILPILRRQFPGQLYISGMLADCPVSLAMLTRADMPVLASIINKSLNAIPVGETAAITRDWIEQADYGQPTIRSILHYRGPQVLAIGATFFALAVLAYLLWQSRRAAVRNEREKATFFAFISHEIRTPMHTVLSSLELLQRSSLTPSQEGRASAALAASESLLTLLDDILQYSRLESRKVTLAPHTVELESWARQSVDMVRWRADEKALALYLSCPASLYVTFDSARVRQIVLNLLVNAIKFTPAGSITLRVDYLPGRHERAGTLMLEVSDTGIGIPVRRIPHIFDAYWQMGHLPDQDGLGSGLGLAICRELVVLMRGSIDVDSAPCSGTTVTVRLPVMTVDAAATPPTDDEPVLEDAPGSDAPRILIIDDHEAVRYALRQQCEALGGIGIVAATAEDALRQLAKTRIDLILLDCNLPNIDGYALARLIRQDESVRLAARVPIVAISAATGDAHNKRCFESGMDSVISKPLRLDALRDLLRLGQGALPVAERMPR